LDGYIILLPPVGPKRDHRCARGFMLDMFMRGIPPEMRNKMYTHFTCATDTDNIKRVFEDIRNSITAKHLAYTAV